MTEPSARHSVDALWALELQRLLQRIGHELRNPLNGALLNVTVVRQAAAANVASFADAALAELERITALLDALLGLARNASAAVDLWSEAQRVAVVYGALATREGGTLTLERDGEGAVESSVSASVARLGLASAMELAIGRSLACVVHGDASGPTVIARSSDALQLSATARIVVAELAQAGVTVRVTDRTLELIFPPAGGMRGASDRT